MQISIEQIAQMAAEAMIFIADNGRPDSIDIMEEVEGAISLRLYYEATSFTQTYIVEEDGTFDTQTIEHAD